MSGRLVLLRHGQSHGNVDRRLDTRPPGAELTDLGRDQARAFARSLPKPPAMVAHSIATRAVQTGREIVSEISAETGAVITTASRTHEFEGIHEVQVGDLENRSDADAHDEFNAVYKRWYGGELDLALPGGETANDVLARYVPVLDQLRLRYLDDDAFHGDIVVVSHGAAIRLVSAVLAGVDSAFAVDHHLANTEAVVLAPITDGRWSCVQWGALTAPFATAPSVTQPTVTQPADSLRSADPMG